jgi:hypothetical protein
MTMAIVREDTRGKTRDLPIKPALKSLLVRAAEASGVDVVRVTSGGQCRKGTCTKRTGSTRHDEGNAADLQLIASRRTLKFTSAPDQKIFERFVTEAARLGATGIGAGLDYMGPDTIHLGYGPRAVWGAGGAAAAAPAWLRRAALAGWARAAPSGTERKSLPEDVLDSPEDEVETDFGELPDEGS